jgi:hypothetical protein
MRRRSLTRALGAEIVTIARRARVNTAVRPSHPSHDHNSRAMSLRRTTEISLRALALLAAVSAIAGCGGSGVGSASDAAPAGSTAARASGSSGPPPPPSLPADFVARAEAICKRHAPEVEAVRATASSPLAIATAARRRAAIERAGLGEMSRLAPPRTADPQWESFLANATKVVQYLEKLSEARKHGGIASAIALVRSYEVGRSQLHAAAASASLSACAQYG